MSHIQSDQPAPDYREVGSEQRLQRSLNQILGHTLLRNLETRREQQNLQGFDHRRNQQTLQHPEFSLPTRQRFWTDEDEVAQGNGNGPEEIKLSGDTFNGPVLG